MRLVLVDGQRLYGVSGSVERQTTARWLSKSGEQVTSNNGEKTSTVAWDVVINKWNRRLTNAKITDTISYGQHKFKMDENGKPVVKVMEATLNPDNTYTLGNEVSTDAYTTSVATDPEAGTESLTVEFNDTINRMYVIQYETEIDDYIGKIKNSVTLTGDEVGSVTVNKDVEVKYTTGSGTGSGETSSLTIRKVGDDGKNLTASFMLYKGHNLAADATPYFSDPITVVDGTLTIEGLRSGNYSLREVAGPEGYIFDPDKFYQVVVKGKQKLKRMFQILQL